MQELYSYVDFMKQFKIDEKLYEAMQNSLISLDKNMTILHDLNKEDDE